MGQNTDFTLGFINTLINIKMHKSRRIFTFFWLLTTLIFPAIVSGQQNSAHTLHTSVYKIDILSEIEPGIARQVSKGIAIAKSRHSDVVLFHINTYGGLLNDADSMRTAILNCPIKTIAFIDNNAASAGALISIACNRIYIRTGGSIGAATVVNDKAEALPDKYQSYMRSLMRSTAEARGRNPIIAEAMVDPRIAIPGINDSGKVLTFTATEALKNGYCNGIASNEKEVLQSEGITNYSVTAYEATWVDKIIGFLVHPAISGVLILVMLGGLYFEMQHPGIGIPVILAIIAAILYFAPLYLDGFAANWEIILSISGFLLIALEIFLMPGSIIVGATGVVALVTGLTFSLLSNDGFDFSHVRLEDSLTALSIVLLAMAGALALFLVGSKYAKKSTAFKKMILHTSMPSGDGFVSSVEMQVAVGEPGLTATLLRPSGKVTINGQAYPATSESGYIEAGENVEVLRIQSAMLVVRKLM
jgi:membrane-bound serine protease (ClpP class)